MSIESKEVPGTARTRATVPWLTVVGTAVLLAYADGFWMTSLRGAVGAIERTQAPFASWWRESTVAVPLYILAMLAALTLALRLFGPVSRTFRTALLTGLLVAAAGTVVGIGQIVASSFYDYYLQSDQLKVMDSMHGLCVDSCLEQAQQSSLLALLRAVLYVSGFLLITNLVLVGWVMAMSGGRLKVAGAGQATEVTGGPGVTGSRVDDVRLLLIAALLGSAHIHAAVIADQLTRWPAAGGFFFLLAAAEIAVAAMLLGRHQQLARFAAAAISIGSLVLWLSSRVIGLPFGPNAFIPEPVGLPDAVAGVLALVAAACAILLLRQFRGPERHARVSAHVRAIMVVAVVTVTAIGLTATAPTWFDGYGSSGSDMVMTP